MDPTSTVRTEAIPAIATVLAPGAYASSPYVWAVLHNANGVDAFLDRHEGIAVFAAILLWTTAGLLIESFGSYVEVYLIDRRRSDRDAMLATWWTYLRINWEKEPVGQRYLRRLVTTFKFELNTSVASIFAVPGMIVLTLKQIATCQQATICSVVLVLVGLLFFWMARSSADVLAKVRAELCKGVGEPPFTADGKPTSKTRD